MGLLISQVLPAMQRLLLTRDMEVEHHPLRAQSVGRCGRNLVDANFAVDVLDPVLDGAYVDVRNGRSVAKVHRYACQGAEALVKQKKVPKSEVKKRNRTLFSSTFMLPQNISATPTSATRRSSGKSCRCMFI